MRERPILFSAPMVRAILDGRKTQTRRAVKHTPLLGYPDDWCHHVGKRDFEHGVGDFRRFCAYGQPGDQLWVRETFATDGEGFFAFRADGETYNDGLPWKPSIHMPRKASRIDLEITGIRVERLQEISYKDTIAEGPRPCGWGNDDGGVQRNFARLWDEINGPGSWDKNPWVWVIEFRRIRP